MRSGFRRVPGDGNNSVTGEGDKPPKAGVTVRGTCAKDFADEAIFRTDYSRTNRPMLLGCVSIGACCSFWYVGTKYQA